MDDRGISGIAMLLGGLLEEVIIQGQNVSFVKQLIPNWGNKVINHWVAIPLMAVGLVSIWARRGRDNKVDANSPTVQHNTAATVQSGGNVTQTAGALHIHIPPYPAPQTSEPIPHSPTLAAPPLIDIQEIRSATILRVPDGAWDNWSEHPAGRKAQIVAFRNLRAEVGQERQPAKDVVARLTYTANNEPSLEINAGCWLGQASQEVNIKAGEVAKLVIAASVRQGEILAALHNPRESLPILIGRRVRREVTVPPIEMLEIPAVPCRVEITLISGGNMTVYHGIFTLRQGTERAMQLDPER
ncbi:MAG TPA: hypothetical protein VFQ00_10580 [Terriglobales bacterium]|nr:hypothetical protein [Terriglobales bacterium]